MRDDAKPAGLSAEFHQAMLGLATLALAGLLAWGALDIPSQAGYAGVGPNFLPWLVVAGLTACGVSLMWQARTGGYRHLDEPSGAASGDWLSLAWVAGALLLNAALMTRIGFVASCALCYVLAVRGLRRSEGRPGGGARTTLLDALIGMAITLPVFWLFTRLLAINLPGLTDTGWI